MPEGAKEKIKTRIADYKEFAVLKVKKPFHIVCCVLNIFAPGWGTCLSACECVNGEKFNLAVLLIGLLQFFFFWTFVLYVLSIVHGCWIYDKSCSKKTEGKKKSDNKVDPSFQVMYV